LALAATSGKKEFGVLLTSPVYFQVVASALARAATSDKKGIPRVLTFLVYF
jgi:translation initiation factor 2B subunit (eIF-2B alpha/beta/delta family)